MDIKELIKQNRPLVIGILILFIGFFLFKFFSGFAQPPKPVSNGKIQRIVKAETAEYKTVPVNLEAFGRIVSSAPVTVTTEVSGMLKKGAVPFLPGSKFKKGDILLRVDDREVKYNLMSAKSQLLNALATLLPELKIEFPEQYKIWQKYFDNFEFDSRTEKLPEADNSRIKLFLARFNVYQLYYNVKNLEILLSKHTIRAPFDGAVITANLRPGSGVRAGAQIGQIIDTGNREIEIPLPVSDRKWIKTGNRVTIVTENGNLNTTGEIVRIGSQINSATETITIYIRLADKRNDNFAVGQFVKVLFPSFKLPNAIVLPEKAVYNDNYIFTVKSGKLHKQKVSTAYHHRGEIVITSGPAAGDTLVIQALQGVSEGLSVRVKSGKEQ